MPPTDSTKSVMDANLFKAIGLYWLLQPTAQCEYGDWYRKAATVVLWLSTAVQCMQIVRLYLVVENIHVFPYTLMLFTSGMICMFKGYVLVMNADRMWILLDATRYGFTSCARRDPSRLYRCHGSLTVWIRTFAVLSGGTMFIWMLAPWFLDGKVSFLKLDGTVGRYRITIYNYWYPISDTMFNWPPVWLVIYTIESIVGNTSVFSMVYFDCILVTMCIVLHAQFHTLSAAYETLGRQSHQSWTSSCSSESCIKNEQNQSDHYKYLIFLIKDNQNLIKKFDEFFDIIWPVVFVQIVVGSYIVITLILFIVLGYITGLSLVSAPILKLISAYTSMTFELYIYCYVFNLLESAKSTLNFGLYSSNWTEMDLKFKKTLLLAMNLNSAHMRVMKVTPKYVISLDLFARVMKMSFSIVPVLLNSNAKKTIIT